MIRPGLTLGLVTSARAIVRTASISAVTVLDGARGALTPERSDVRLVRWAEALLRDAGARVSVEDAGGLEAARGGEPLVVMSNHQSLYDVPALFVALPGRLRMVAKSELFAVPLWGDAMAAAGFVRVDRNDPKAAIDSLREAAAHLRAGTRIWIAPEGTRSATGALLPFKKGGFHLAASAGVRVLPVAISGTRGILPARAVAVRKSAEVRVRILPPVASASPLPELRDAVRRALGEALVSMGEPPPDPPLGPQGRTTSR